MTSAPLFYAYIEAGRGGGLRPNNNQQFLKLKDTEGNAVALPMESNYTLFTPTHRPLPIDLPMREWTVNHLKIFLGVEMSYGNYEWFERILPLLESGEAASPEEKEEASQLSRYLALEKELRYMEGEGLEDAMFNGVSDGSAGSAVEAAFTRIGELNEQLNTLRPLLEKKGLL